MTERWRKKLEGIDRVDPSDDVYQRAKSGPNLPEPRSPMQRTSTRVVTAIAAFVVFALGISVFAIPALRLRGNVDFVSGGTQVQPLWPWNSIDDVHAWRDDPQPIGTVSVDHVSSPDEVATAFGRDVLGWGEVWAYEEGTPQTYPCANGMPWGVGISPSPTAPGDLCSVVYPSASLPPTLAPYAPTTAPPAFRTFDLSTCPPNAACDYTVGPPDVSVVVYQPLGSDGPWAILEARTRYIGLSLAAGTPLRDGSTVYASGYIPRGAHAVLGFHAASEGCGETGSITGFEETPNDAGSDLTHGLPLGTYSRGQLGIGLAPVETSCQHQAGYTFVAITSDDLGTGDPLGGIRSDVGVVGFAAVPVSFAFPTSSGASPSDPPTPTPTPTPSSTETSGGGWKTHTSSLGFTIDVPPDWSITETTDTLIVSALIAHPYVQINRLAGGSLHDDSPFPLDYTVMEGDPQPHFWMSGDVYIIRWYTGDGSPPTPEQAAVFGRITSSIAFAGATPTAGPP